MVVAEHPPAAGQRLRREVMGALRVAEAKV